MMKNNYKKSNQKLGALIILFWVAYGLLIVNGFMGAWKDYRMLYNKIVYLQKNNQLRPIIPSDVYHFKVKEREILNGFQDSIINLKDSTFVKTKYSEIEILVPRSVSKPSLINYGIIVGIMEGISSIVHFYIFFQLLYLMISMKQEIVFHKKNVRTIRKIGISFLILFLAILIHNYSSFKINEELFDFENYIIVQPLIKGIWLLLGIAVLLIAEVISNASVIKGEQELTI